MPEFNWQLLLAVYLLLALFATGYNQFVGWMEEQYGLDHGFLAEQVVVGVTVVLVCLIPLIGAWDTLVATGAFASAGVIMWVGARLRHFRRQRQGDRRLSDAIEDVLDRAHGDETKTTRRSR